MKFNIKISRFFIYIFVFMILFLPIGIYFAHFSPDYSNYIEVLHDNIDQFDYNKFEPGYWFIVYINQLLFSGTPFGLYFIYEFLILILWFIAIKKYSYNYLVSLIIFLFVFLPNEVLIQIRQGLAIGIFLLAIDDIVNRRALRYFLKIIIAIFFHYSSIVLLPLYFLNSNKINRIFYILLPIIGFLFYKFILNLAFFNSIMSYLPLSLQFKLTQYIILKQQYGNYSSVNKINLLNLYVITLLIIYYIILLFDNLKNKYIIVFIKLLGIRLFIWFIFAFLPVISFRLSYFFDPVIMFLFSYIPFLFKNKIEKQLILVVFLFWSIFMGINLYILHQVFNFNA